METNNVCCYFGEQVHDHTPACWLTCPQCGKSYHSTEGAMYCRHCTRLVYLTVPESMSRHDCSASPAQPQREMAGSHSGRE